MMKWYRKRVWIYGFLIGLIVVDIVLYTGWLKTPLDNEGGGAAQVALLEREVTNLREEVTRLRMVRDHLPELGPRINTFSTDRLLSAATGFSEIADDLERAAGQTGVALRRIAYDVEQVEELPNMNRIMVSTSVEGTYSQLLLYVETLQQSSRLYIIEDVEVAGTARRQLSLEMQLSAYRNQGAG